MRLLALTTLAALAAGCATRGDLQVAQSHDPVAQGVVRFDEGQEYRGAVALESIGGVSRKSYLFAEPNQRVIRPIVEDALANSGLQAAAGQNARYNLRIEVGHARGPHVGATYNADFAATYIMVNRATGAEVWRREIRSPGVATFLASNEGDAPRAWSMRRISAVVVAANPMNFFPFASDSAADRARTEGARSGYAHASAERNGAERAAHANYAAVAANVATFLEAFAVDNGVQVIPVFPCHGSPEVEAQKAQLQAAGRTFVTDTCPVNG
jgi:hypothetical protein